MQESILKNVQYDSVDLQFAPVVDISFLWDVEDILFGSNIAVSSDESVLVDGVPVDEQVDDWAVISRDKSRQLCEEADCHTVVWKSKEQ